MLPPYTSTVKDYPQEEKHNVNNGNKEHLVQYYDKNCVKY
jgi:hypothetical protein